MDNTTCPKCGAEISGDINFCPKCGANLLEVVAENWTCKNCGAENSGDALFCTSCGESKSKQASIFYSPMFKFGILLALIIFIGGFGSYAYFNGLNEDKYLTYYAAASRDFDEAETSLENQIKISTIKATKTEDLIKQLNNQKNILKGQLEIFTQMTPFKNYDKQHADMTAALQKEIEIIDGITQIISNPLDSGVEANLETLKKNLDTVNNLKSQINIPNVIFTPHNDLAAITGQLDGFVKEQKTFYAERVEKLNANQEFFRQMDNLISRYDAARTDLGKMMESLRKSDMTWNDYFNMLDRAKSERSSIRYSANEINPPAGTEHLRQEFVEVLNEAVRYCEMMRAAANLGFNNYGFQRYMKEQESKEVDTNVSEMYDAFISRYETEKRRLTNINNL